MPTSKNNFAVSENGMSSNPPVEQNIFILFKT
jgi:hypothetical protein